MSLSSPPQRTGNSWKRDGVEQESLHEHETTRHFTHPSTTTERTLSRHNTNHDLNSNDANLNKIPMGVDSGEKPKFWLLTGLPSELSESSFRLELNNYFGNEAHDSFSPKDKFKFSIISQPHDSSLAIITSYRAPRIGDIAPDQNFEGVTPLYVPTNATVDIVAVPGLGGHPLGSFRSSDGWNVWLRDFLPEDIPSCRVLVYGYNTSVGGSQNKSSIGDLSKTFLESLNAFRSQSQTLSRPIIFIGHSLGGLVIKEALAIASDGRDELQTNDLLLSTHGLMFFGVPNLGLRYPQLLTIVNGKPNERLIRDLIVDRDSEPSTYLEELTKKFTKTCKAQSPPFRIFAYYERRPSATVEQDSSGRLSRTGQSDLLVTKESACRIGCMYQDGVGFDADHRDLVRFESRNNTYYSQVLNRLRGLAEGAPQTIDSRFTTFDPEQIASLSEDDDNSIHQPRRADAEIMARFLESSTRDSQSRQHTPMEMQLAIRRKSPLQYYLESLNFDQIHARHRNIKAAHAGTCTWVLESPEYQKWLAPNKPPEQQKILWIKGKPGTGKSTIMKTLLASAEEMANCTVISFFFDARGLELEKSTIGMYRALMYQLLSALPDLQGVLASLPAAKADTPSSYAWKVETLELLFENAVKRLKDYSLIIFIDALDECDNDQVREMLSFFQRLAGLQDTRHFRACFSSRHYPNVTIRNSIQLILEDQRDHHFDLKTYVDSKLNAKSSKLIAEIKTEILEKASGIFLWVVLVVPMLNKEYDKGHMHALRSRLREIPKGLDDLFKDILTRDTESTDALVLCLQWLMFARRPLVPEELYHAVLIGTEPTYVTPWDPEYSDRGAIERFILNTSKGLAEVTKGNRGIVQFIHESVRDYLKGNELSFLRPNLIGRFQAQSHEELKNCCQAYTNLDISPHPSQQHSEEIPSPEESSEPDASEKLPFLSYAVHNILHHADAAAESGISQHQFMERFSFDSWLCLYRAFRSEDSTLGCYSSTVSALYVFANEDLGSLISIELENAAIMDIEGEEFGYPLLAAINQANGKAVRALLAPAVASKLQNQQISVSEEKREAIIKHLLDKAKGSPYSKSQTLLSWATQNNEVDVFMALLATGRVDLNAKDQSRRRTPLSWAANHGQEMMVKVLLSASQVDVNAKDDLGMSPLSLAAAGGHDKVAKHLLETGRVNVNIRAKGGYTPMGWAAAGGHAAVVKLLLASHAEMNSKDFNGRTPLLMAAAAGHDSVVSLLLETGKVDVDARDHSHYRTPLSWAAANGHEAVVKLLIATGQVDVNARDHLVGWAPLPAAVTAMHRAVVKLLLASGGVEIDCRDNDGRTPLSWAAESGCETIVELLLDTGKAEVDSRDNNGRTPLMWAVKRKHTAVIEMLVATGYVDTGARDNDGWTPLSWAEQRNHSEIVQLLKR